MPSGQRSDPGLAGKARGDLLNALGAFSIAASFNKPDFTHVVFGILIGIGILSLVAALLAYWRIPAVVFRVERPNPKSRLLASIAFSSAIIATAAIMFVLSLKFRESLGVLWSIYGFLVSLMIFAQVVFLFVTRYDETGFWPTVIFTSLLAVSSGFFSAPAIVCTILIEGFPVGSEPGQVVLAGFMVATPAVFWILIEFTNIVVSGINIKNNEPPYISTVSGIKSLFQIFAGGALVAGIWINWWTIIAFVVAVFGTGLGIVVGVIAYLSKPLPIERHERASENGARQQKGRRLKKRPGRRK